MQHSIKIWLWGKEVGSLMWREERHNSYFVYHPDYLNDPMEPFLLMAPKKGAISRTFHSDTARMYQRLPAFLADSLPDDWGNALFEQWRIDQGLSVSQVTPLEKLMFIGSRGMGALEFVPDAQMNPRTEKIDIAALAQLAQKIFNDREKAVIEPNETITKKLLMMVGTSVGGRQPKALIAIHRETGEIRSGQIAGLEGYDYYILKFGNAARSFAELEMTYYEMACMAGIHMMPSQLLEADGEKHFLTQRFDRKDGQKWHLQTLAAMNPDADSYEQLLLVCRNLHLPDATGEEIFRRMVFNYLANNTDDHNKNFSFILSPNGQWALTPAYDMTFIFNVGGYQPQREHCLMMRGKLTDWSKEDVMLFAEQNGIRNAEKIIGQVATAIMQFRAIALRNGVRHEWIGCVEECLMTHLREWGFVEPQPDNQEWILHSGQALTHVYLEQAYKGNIHLYATINGAVRRWVLRSSMPEYKLIMEMGMANVPQEMLCRWIEQRL